MQEHCDNFTLVRMFETGNLLPHFLGKECMMPEYSGQSEEPVRTFYHALLDIIIFIILEFFCIVRDICLLNINVFIIDFLEQHTLCFIH